ncbi:hypothetical protein ACLKMH_12610 [Psychromonas sp. KJ10-10]|uniref:hypothetical protein n=1 Tax=Psychromonas sp. KJ10-10 TaxID=3391823 RepID=UPI0039B6E89E
MKRFITLILMFAMLVTFTQKATAFPHLLVNETSSMSHCSMPKSSDISHMKMGMMVDCENENTSMSMGCQNDCDLMSMGSVLYFNEHFYTVHQIKSQLAYQTNITASPYYFPESLYRPPFLN